MATMTEEGTPLDYQVVIVGAGVAGSSAMYHLTTASVNDILVIDGGSAAGEGYDENRKSGTAVMNKVAPTIKMMVQVFACDCQTFISHHGIIGARRYLNLTARGMQLQKDLAAKVQLTPDQLQELGSFYIGYERDEEELRYEFETLQSLGCTDIEWYDKTQLQRVDGCSPDFHCAIFFPKDAIIDSSTYAKKLLRASQSTGRSVQTLMETKVARVSETRSHAVIELESGRTITCQHVVMATGGLFQVPELCGILRPCYSYLVHVPVDNGIVDSSPNFFTWRVSHDWCFAKGKIRCSGEDHYSAYKPPLCRERCHNLSKWTLERYSSSGRLDTKDLDEIPQQYGVYSETPDYAPLIGTMHSNSKVYYLLGCNAWGQTVLSYSSSLIPGLLGYTPLTAEQRDHLKLLSIRRFSCLPEVY